MEAVIRSALSMLDNDRLNDLIAELTRMGVKTDDDLQYVTSDDLKDFLSPIDCRKRIHSSKAEVSHLYVIQPEFGNVGTFFKFK